MKNCHTCQQSYADDVEFCPHDGVRLADQLTETEAQLGAGLSRRYRIIRRLGAGGMGTVFLAQQIGVGSRPVALKVLRRNLLDDPEFLLRFQNEAGSTGSIHHPNVVTIYESAQADDGTPYIAMEFLEGEALSAALQRRGALPVREVAEILLQAARGLNAAHKLGIIHRDLKPDNIFLTRGDEGELITKVVDFGIAKLRESATHTLTGMVLGTPAYMSYEQASGMKSDDLDARSDIYSLGVVVYEMLSGRAPFHADTPFGYVRKHMLEEPPPFQAAALGQVIAPQVEATVMKALVKDRDQRYPSVLDFARDFCRAASASSPKDSPKQLATMQRDEPARGLGGLLGEPSAPPAARPAEIALKTPPPLHESPEQSWRRATRLVTSADASLEPAATPQPSLPKPELPPDLKRVLAKLPGSASGAIQKERSSRTGIASLVAAVMVVIVAALVWGYWPRPKNPIHREVVGPSMGISKPNPTPPGPPPQEPARPASQVGEIPTPATGTAGFREKVNAAITDGDSYYDDGKYDRAIAAYEAGLVADPGNDQLRQKIQRAKTAKAAESSVPQ